MPSYIDAGDSVNGVNIARDTDGALTIRTGPNAGKVNALALDASGNAAVLGTLTQAGVATLRRQVGATVNTTSGTAVEITLAAPSWAKRVILAFNSVSTTGTSPMLIQIGSGSFATSGYNSAAMLADNGGMNTLSSTAGFILMHASKAGISLSGNVYLELSNSNLWTESFSLGSSGNIACMGGGHISLGGALDRIRITTVGGTDTFDAGSITSIFEG